MFRVSGWIYERGRFRDGSVEVDAGVIQGVSRQRSRDSLATGLILPTFTNAHTHAGDAVVRDVPTGTLEELVAPPRGLKHRVLATAKDEDVVAAMRGYIGAMLRTGTTSFWDFRETGLRGVRQLFEASLGFPVRPLVFGRPVSMGYDREEVRTLLRVCDGIGLSSLLDWDADVAAKLAREAHAAGRGFALHASERVREDIDGILDLRPDLLVHLTEATDADLARVADASVPVAVCPRSNLFFGKILDLPRMVRAGLRLHLGTDNAMVNAPSMLRELDLAWKVSRLRGGLEPSTLLDMALRGGKGISGPDDAALVPGEPADLLVLEIPGGRPTVADVFRSVEADIALVSAGGRTWVRKIGELAELGQGPRRAGRAKPIRRRRRSAT